MKWLWKITVGCYEISSRKEWKVALGGYEISSGIYEIFTSKEWKVALDGMKYPQARNEKLHWDSMKYLQARNEKLHWEGMKYPQARNEKSQWDSMKYPAGRNEKSHWGSNGKQFLCWSYLKVIAKRWWPWTSFHQSRMHLRRVSKNCANGTNHLIIVICTLFVSVCLFPSVENVHDW